MWLWECNGRSARERAAKGSERWEEFECSRDEEVALLLPLLQAAPLGAGSAQVRPRPPRRRSPVGSVFSLLLSSMVRLVVRLGAPRDVPASVTASVTANVTATVTANVPATVLAGGGGGRGGDVAVRGGGRM